MKSQDSTNEIRAITPAARAKRRSPTRAGGRNNAELQNISHAQSATAAPLSTHRSRPAPKHDWLALEVLFKLHAPWFQEFPVRDDLRSCPLNDSIEPFIPAASWRSQLRWAANLKAGVMARRSADNDHEANWQMEPQISHLFGDENSRSSYFKHGALTFRATCFDQLGFDLVRPMKQANTSVTKDRLHEFVHMVPIGHLNILYTAMPSVAVGFRRCSLELLFDAVEALITEHGVSANPRLSSRDTASVITAELRWRTGAGRGTLKQLRATLPKVLKSF